MMLSTYDNSACNGCRYFYKTTCRGLAPGQHPIDKQERCEGYKTQPMTTDHLQEIYEKAKEAITPKDGGYYTMHYIDANGKKKMLTFKVDDDDLF